MYGEEHKDKFAFSRIFIINKFFESIHRGILQRRSLPSHSLLPFPLFRMSEHHFSKKKKRKKKKRCSTFVHLPLASVSMSQAVVPIIERISTNLAAAYVFLCVNKLPQKNRLIFVKLRYFITRQKETKKTGDTSVDSRHV